MRAVLDRDALAETGPAIVRFAALAGVALAAIAVVLVFGRGDDSYEVNAIFDDARGLIEGGEVKAAAVNVGIVDEITIGDDGLPHVTMSVDNDFRLRQGAFADLRVASNVGAINRYVDLRQGEGPELEDGATLGPSETDQPVDLDLAVSTLDPATREDVATVIAGLDRGTKGRGPDVAETLRHSSAALNETANLLGQVAVDEEALSAVVNNTDAIVGALARSPSDLGGAADQLAVTLRVAAARQVELRRTAELFGPGLAGARGAIERLASAIPNLREFVAAARPAVFELRPTGRALRPALEALRPVLDEAAALVRDAPRQLRALAPALRIAPSVVKRLEPIVDGFNPFLDHLRARIPEVIGFFVLAADGTSNYDINGNMIRSTTINIQLPRHPNLIGPSDDGPGSVVRPFDRTPGSLEGEPWEVYPEDFIGGGRPPQSFIEPGEEGP